MANNEKNMYLNPRKILNNIENAIVNDQRRISTGEARLSVKEIDISIISDIDLFTDLHTNLLNSQSATSESTWVNFGSYNSSDSFIEVRADDTLMGLFSFSKLSLELDSILTLNYMLLKDTIIGIRENENNISLSEVLFLNAFESEKLVSFRMFWAKESIKAIFLRLEQSDTIYEQFLHDIDAKLIPIHSISDLIQGESFDMLLCFPQLVGEVFKVNHTHVEGFFLKTYQEIDKAKLNEQLNDITYENKIERSFQDKFIYLSQIPRKETPLINFKRIAICLEVLVDDDYIDPDFLKSTDAKNIKENHNFSFYIRNDGEAKLNKANAISEYLKQHGYCIFTHSYETDLFSFKYQNTPPYYTKNYAAAKPFTIEFPNVTEFISEGRKESFYQENHTDEKDLEMKGYANYTYFFNSKIRVWHLVLIPNKSITEIQVIKLMKIFSGIQESGETSNSTQGSSYNSSIFKCGDIKTDWKGLFQYISGIEYKFKDAHNLDKALNSGIVAIDMKYNDYNIHSKKLEIVKNEVREKFNALYSIIQNNEGDLSTQNRETEEVFKALCGITLGILDFGRMGIEEISDTLAPREHSITPTSFLTLNRGVLTSFAVGDDVFNSAWKTLGINPYLMIPSAVLAHNDFISRDAEERLNHAWSLCSDKSGYRVKLKDLIDERNYIDDLINDDILANVFQYPTERELYDYGMKHRGINDRIIEVKSKLIQLDKIIEQKQQEKANANDRIIQSVLTFLSLLQIASFVADFGLKEIFEKHSLPEINKWTIVLIIVLACVLGYFIFLSNTVISFKIKMKKEKLSHRKTQWDRLKEFLLRRLPI